MMKSKFIRLIRPFVRISRLGLLKGGLQTNIPKLFQKKHLKCNYPELSKYTNFIRKDKSRSVAFGLSSIPFTFDYDLKVPLSHKLHTNAATVTSSYRMVVEMPIDVCIKPNTNSDKVVVEVYLDIVKPNITKEQREWAESLEVCEKTSGFLFFEKDTMEVKFSRKIIGESYPPSFCIIRIPPSIQKVEANIVNKGSNVGVKDNLLSGIEITMEGGKCMLKNHQSDFVAVEAGNGDCSVEKTHALVLMLSTGSGDCYISDSTSSFNAKTTSGSVHVKDSNATFMSVETESGDCHMTNNRCNAMLVSSRSGNLELRNNKSNHLDATTQTGATICAGNEFLFGEGCKSTLKPTLYSPDSCRTKLEPTQETCCPNKSNKKPSKDEPACGKH